MSKKTSHITRRDFLNGALITLGSTLLPPIALGQSIERLIDSDHYPPLLNGLRGSTDEAYKVAHQLAWTGSNDWGKIKNNNDESYDLVIVGGGISGLAAARFYQQKYGRDVRILILDNNDDFGGHARRNEFNVDGQTQLSYGGSQSMEEPGGYSEISKELLLDIGVDIEKFNKAYDLDFFEKYGLESKTFFDKELFSYNQLVPFKFAPVEHIPGLPDGSSSYQEAIDRMPLESAAKAQLLRLYSVDDDTLDDVPILDRLEYAQETLYYDYLRDKLGITHPQIFELLRHLASGNVGVGSDTYTLIEAVFMKFPGIKPRAIVPLVGDSILDNLSDHDEPYIYHFPDGNASIARLLVRKLIPAVASGDTMEDIVLAKFRYEQLDQPDSKVRLRLESTVVNVVHEGDVESSKGLIVTYVKQDNACQVKAKHCVMACYNMMIPYLIPDLPNKQKSALKQLVKSPLVYTSVLLKNWRAMHELSIGAAYCPGRMHTFVAMDYPVSMGGYNYSKSPDEPVTLHMEYIPSSSTFGLPPREQFREGRYQLLTTSFAQFEKEIKTHLADMLGPGGFDPDRDILSITVNRWSHGYAYSGHDYFDPQFYDNDIYKMGRQPYGRITIANSDSGASAYMNSAIDQAWRAVNELT
ncbi:NAD(P)/FAD-dependent oxidoreductase [Vibrio mediterranei]|uniref:NAD(P)/FAD-dependent oxidoreductase n=1 Tax=Vibrio mediterranei TaxID=689 RepID=A0A3G4VBV7_9VIBR|nr:NAD(P)/FAD-dependent oxidoreductase [Vibrio mediterranei]AYV22266.1 NAD(P)/FAD-dependent oxidoreductase [Vibrio mediterranei]